MVEVADSNKPSSMLLIDIKRKYRLFKVCYVSASSSTFLALFLFFAAATNSTNEANKAGGMSH